MDVHFVDKIVNEVKAQGVFDQFRRECMSDCDTKPAYQNLRQRVENSVSRFLSDQKWKPDMNKNQLREKLRKHIADGRFLEIGVERIVDQVVLPKISTIFQPKIEDIVYKYLGIEKLDPKYEEEKSNSNDNYQNGNLEIKTDLLPTDNLEEISPDSDISNIKNVTKEQILEDEEDDESPPFESLIETTTTKLLKDEVKDEHGNSLSGLSGLTSPSLVDVKKESTVDNIKEEEEKQLNISGGDNTQESQLSEVSSNSRLSIDEDGDERLPKKEMEQPKVDICEEAQMPKFHENSNSCSLMSTELLHFDIKKDEIKFEGTDRNIEYESIKLENTTPSPIPPPPPPSNPEIPPPPPSEKTEESYDDDSEKALQIVEETQTKDEVGHQQSEQNPVTNYKNCFGQLDIFTNESGKNEITHPNSIELSPTKKNQTNDDAIDKSNNKTPDINSSEISLPTNNSSKTNAEYKSKENCSRRSSSSHRKHSKDRRSEKDREKDKYRSSYKNSNSDKRVNSNEKSSSSRNGFQSSSTKDNGKEQKVSSKSLSSSSHHKSKNEKYSNESKDKYRSDRNKKRYKDKNTDDHLSSRNKYSSRKSTDSEDGGEKKQIQNSTAHKASFEKNKSSISSKQEIENNKKQKSNNNIDEKDIGNELPMNDLEKIEFVLGIQRNDNKLDSKECNKSNQSDDKLTFAQSSSIEGVINDNTILFDECESTQFQNDNDLAEKEHTTPHIELTPNDNEKDLKYILVTNEEKNEYQNIFKAYNEYLKSYNSNDATDKNSNKNESLKRKRTWDHFDGESILSAESTSSNDKRSKSDDESPKKKITTPTLELEVDDINIKLQDVMNNSSKSQDQPNSLQAIQQSP